MSRRASIAATVLVSAIHSKQDVEHRFVEPTLFTLFWIFTLASVAGLVGETLVSALADGYVKSRAGLVWGPFSPLYGLGALLMTLALNDLKGRSKLLIFLVAALVGGALEFCAGWFWEHFFGIVAWSYLDQPLNICGYTCAGMMIVWGLAGLAWVSFGIPLTLRLIGLIPQRLCTVLTVFMVAFMAADIVTTLLSFNFWFERLSGVHNGSALATYFAQHYGNEWMSRRFQALSMWTDLATGR